MGAQYWSVYVDSETQLTRSSLHEALRILDLALRTIESRPELELARTADDVTRITKAGRIASLLGVEGGHMIESSPAVVRIFHRLGARYLTLTHWRNVEWADAATDTPRANGLTKAGEMLVRELNRTGIFADIAHVSPDVMRDVLRVSKAPVISSHSDAFALVHHPRNIPDDVLRLVGKNGGVVHVSFIREFVVDGSAWEVERKEARRSIRQRVATDAEADKELAAWGKEHPAPGGSVADVANVIDHIKAVAGVDHVGIGADFFDSGTALDGAGAPGPHHLPPAVRRAACAGAGARRTSSSSPARTTSGRCGRWSASPPSCRRPPRRASPRARAAPERRAGGAPGRGMRPRRGASRSDLWGPAPSDA